MLKVLGDARIGNGQIKGRVTVEQFGGEVREAPWRWFGHFLRQRMLERNQPGKRERGNFK